MGKKSHNLTLSSIKLKLCSINLEISFFRKIATACNFHTNNYYSIPHNSMTGQMGSNVKDILFTRRFMTAELKKKQNQNLPTIPWKLDILWKCIIFRSNLIRQIESWLSIYCKTAAKPGESLVLWKEVKRFFLMIPRGIVVKYSNKIAFCDANAVMFLTIVNNINFDWQLVSTFPQK